MIAVLRLVWTYFTATAWSRWLSAIGLIVVAGGIIFPGAVANSRYLPAVCFAGGAAFFLGSAFMPLLVARMIRSHQLAFLPYGRLKLIVSALLTNILVSSPIPVMSMLVSLESFSQFALRTKIADTRTFRDYFATHFFAQISLTTFFWTTWMYIVLWSITSSRNAVGLLRTLLIIIALLAVPPRYVSIDLIPLTGLVLLIVLSWTLFVGALILSPRLKHSPLQSAWLALRERWGADFKSTGHVSLLLGIANRWLIALSAAICIVLDTLFIPLRGPWLFFLAILGLVAGAVAGKAAYRSRSLWLRLACTRTELFSRVERLLWRHSLPSVGIIFGWLITVGGYNDRPAWIFYGIPLIGLATTASLYLGLMQTTALRIADATIAVTTTLVVIGIAIYAASDAPPAAVIALEFLLGIGAVVFRSIAKHRWTELDWCSTPRFSS